MKDRELTKGKPYGRARAMGGGQLMVFQYYATQQEAEEAITERNGKTVPQFVVFLPHLVSRFDTAHRQIA